MTPARGVTLQQQIEAYADELHSQRVVVRAIVEGQEAKRQLQAMTEQTSAKVLIKGLAEAMGAAKKSIAAARAAPVDLQQSAAALAATCADLKKQVDDMHDDIKFEASQLGNGGETSGQSGSTS